MCAMDRATSVVNYDGSITSSPRRLVFPQTVAEIQAILRDSAEYPSPVRAKGSYHSLTPCASSDGTMVDMSHMTAVVSIDLQNGILTAQAGLQIIEAARALRPHNMQLMTNIEIGNMTLGSAACCHTKDALDGIEFGQVSSYVTAIKWVRPDGELGEASEADNPELLRLARSSYGLCGIVYEVSLRIKPLEILHFTYEPHPIESLTQTQVEDILNTSEGVICWTVGRTCIFQRRRRVDDPSVFDKVAASVRRELWDFGVAHTGHFIDQFLRDAPLREAVHGAEFAALTAFYESLHLAGGISLAAPDKIIDYRATPQAARYAFTFWGFPRAQWLATLRDYLDFAEAYFGRTGFRCNMPLGAYFVRRDTSSVLSYAYDGDIFSIDPIHASTDDAAWHAFLRTFNEEFAAPHHGIPLLNQSPFVQRAHVQAAYGQRWEELRAWVASVDPKQRMVNPFFAELLG